MNSWQPDYEQDPPVPQIEIGAFSAELLSLPSPLFDSLLSEGRMWWWVGFNVLFKDSLHRETPKPSSCSSGVIETEPFLTPGLTVRCRNQQCVTFNLERNQSDRNLSIRRFSISFNVLNWATPLLLLLLLEPNSFCVRKADEWGVFPDKRFDQYAGGWEDNLDNLDNSPNVVVWIPLD